MSGFVVRMRKYDKKGPIILEAGGEHGFATQELAHRQAEALAEQAGPGIVTVIEQKKMKKHRRKPAAAPVKAAANPRKKKAAAKKKNPHKALIAKIYRAFPAGSKEVLNGEHVIHAEDGIAKVLGYKKHRLVALESLPEAKLHVLHGAVKPRRKNAAPAKKAPVRKNIAKKTPKKHSPLTAKLYKAAATFQKPEVKKQLQVLERLSLSPKEAAAWLKPLLDQVEGSLLRASTKAEMKKSWKASQSLKALARALKQFDTADFSFLLSDIKHAASNEAAQFYADESAGLAKTPRKKNPVKTKSGKDWNYVTALAALRRGEHPQSKDPAVRKTLAKAHAAYVKSFDPKPKKKNPVVYRCVSDSYDPDGGVYATVKGFLAMCKTTLGKAPKLKRSANGGWYDAQGYLVLEEERNAGQAYKNPGIGAAVKAGRVLATKAGKKALPYAKRAAAKGLDAAAAKLRANRRKKGKK